MADDSLIVPEWPAPGAVRALVTTRAFGDAKNAKVRQQLRNYLPAEPRWLRQVHGTNVVDAGAADGEPEADASVARAPGVVCAVMVADCMPVLIADAAGRAVGVAHAGWRGLAHGVIERTLDALDDALGGEPGELLAWLGPAIGPRVYEVGDEVRAAFLAQDPAAEFAFRATRRGHWLLDLYALARQRLAARGVMRVFGGTFCTYSEPARFFSFRRERVCGRMAALIWID
jgi:YfiH family protein